MARIPLVGAPYAARSLAAGAQTCINLYSELTEDPLEKAKGIGALYGCPGRTLWKTLTTVDAAATPLRGLWSGGGRLFVFAGTKYFELNSAGALVGSVRTISNSANSPVQAFGNGNQLLIISDSNVYIDNGAGPTTINIGASAGVVTTTGVIVDRVSGDGFPTDTSWELTNITINGVVYLVDTVSSPDLLYLIATAGNQTNVAYSHGGEALTGVTGAYLDGYFLVNRPAAGAPDLGRSVNFSAILDGTNWDGTDVFVKEGYPDYIRSILADGEQLYVFGRETMQVFQNTGNATTPFQPIPGTMARVGSISPWGPVAIGGKVYFIGGAKGDLAAYVLDGYTPRRISTHPIEAIWKAASLGPSCVSYGYLEEGHSMWTINFGAQAWAFDTTTGLWHQRASWTGSAFATYPTYYHTWVEWPNGVKQHLTGGAGNGVVYESSVNFYSDAGADIKWERAVPYIYNQGKQIFFGRTMVEMQTGTVASGAEPTISMDYSDNRGRTFSTPITAGIGVNNESEKQVFWHPTGSSYGRVMRFSGIGQSKIALIDLNVESTMGDV